MIEAITASAADVPKPSEIFIEDGLVIPECSVLREEYRMSMVPHIPELTAAILKEIAEVIARVRATYNAPTYANSEPAQPSATVIAPGYAHVQELVHSVSAWQVHCAKHSLSRLYLVALRHAQLKLEEIGYAVDVSSDGRTRPTIEINWS